MNITTYIVTLKHDGGKHRIQVCSLQGLNGAIEQILAIENCPESAIYNIRKVEPKRRRNRTKGAF